MAVPARSPEERRRISGPIRAGLGLLGILIGIWLVYAGTLQAPWVFDDHKYLVDPVLHPSDLSAPALLDAATGTSREAARWLPNLSFALQFYLWGSENTLPFHLLNVVLHCLVVLVVFLFLRSTLLLAGAGSGKAARVALLATALFAFNPIQTQAVSYVWQRSTSMVALVFLLAMWLLAEGLRRRGSERYWRLALALLLIPVCALTKQNGVMLPFVMAGYAWLCGTPRRPRTLVVGLAAMGLVAALVLFGLVIPLWYRGGSIAEVFEQVYAFRPFTMEERLLTQPRVVLHLLSLLLLPLPSRLNLDHHVQTSHGLFEPWTTGVALLGVAGLVLLGCLSSRRRPLLGLGVLWWFVLLIPESTVAPLEMMFEHRAYLPSVGILLLLGLGLDRTRALLIERGVSMRTVSVLGLGLMLLLIAGTYQRNKLWSDPVLLWSDALTKSPDKARPNHNLAHHLERLAEARPVGDPERVRLLQGADDLFIRAGALDPERGIFARGAARALVRQERYEEAEAALVRLLEEQVNAETLTHLGVVHLRQERWDEATDTFRRAIELDDSIPEAHFNLACGLARRGQGDDALDALAAALAVGFDDRASIEQEPAFEQLRDRARFAALLEADS